MFIKTNLCAASETLGADWVGVTRRVPAMRSSDVTYRQAKIALKATSEDELLELEAMAKSLNLAARSILDALVVVSRILRRRLTEIRI